MLDGDGIDPRGHVVDPKRTIGAGEHGERSPGHVNEVAAEIRVRDAVFELARDRTRWRRLPGRTLRSHHTGQALFTRETLRTDRALRSLRPRITLRTRRARRALEARNTGGAFDVPAHPIFV